jgi:hypothetical protein
MALEPITLGLISAGGSLLSGWFGAKKQKKEANLQNQRISEVMKRVADLRLEGKQDLQKNQLQIAQRNINVQSASGFTSSSFDRLNTYLRDIEFAKETRLYDKATELQLKEIEAGRPVSQSSLATGLGVATNAFSTFASFYTAK